MVETLLGGVFGGLLRLAPELLKLLDRRSERQHELQMISLEHDFAKTQAEVAIRIGQQQVQVREFEAIAQASDEQSRTSVAAGWLIASINALVRPLTTYLFLGCYFLVKLALYSLAVQQGGAWQQVIVSLWTADDATILFMIISFWFVGRVYERKPN